MGELIELLAVIGVLLCLGLVFTSLLQGAGNAGAGIGAGIGSIFAGLGAMFDGLGSGAGKAAKGGGGGVGKAAKGVGKGLGSLAKGAASGTAKMLPKAGKAAGSMLSGLGVGAAAVGAAGAKRVHRTAKKGAKAIGTAADKVKSSEMARSVRNAAKRASAGAKASLRTEAQELAEDVKFGLGMETSANGQRQHSAYGWQIDPTAADDLHGAFEEYEVCHNWHQDPETGEWYVIFPSEEVGFARSVMDEAGFAVDGGGVPAEWYEPADAEVYDEESDEWVSSPARTGGPTTDTPDDIPPDGVPLDETAFGAGDADAIDAEFEDVTVEGEA